jgi:hypothetical protein
MQKMYEMITARKTTGMAETKDMNLDIEVVETPDGFLEICFKESQEKQVSVFQS